MQLACEITHCYRVGYRNRLVKRLRNGADKKPRKYRPYRNHNQTYKGTNIVCSNALSVSIFFQTTTTLLKQSY
ncbi:hypothetical protein SAMN04489710_110163 [Paracidovorax konjaci]|uniref:Uncharacterized protein n=1 Tax=Paracidovorax konjaci TaxID=32040 RepID=A0A1I1WQE0_9BURK|nr:hypothetical protein SAMN04489710_110163 [Paracidovorax konjaci]